MTDQPTHREHAHRAAQRTIDVGARQTSALLAIYELLDERLPQLASLPTSNLDVVTTRQLLETLDKRMPSRPVAPITDVTRYINALRHEINLALRRLPAEILDYRPEYQ